VLGLSGGETSQRQESVAVPSLYTQRDNDFHFWEARLAHLVSHQSPCLASSALSLAPCWISQLLLRLVRSYLWGLLVNVWCLRGWRRPVRFLFVTGERVARSCNRQQKSLWQSSRRQSWPYSALLAGLKRRRGAGACAPAHFCGIAWGSRAEWGCGSFAWFVGGSGADRSGGRAYFGSARFALRCFFIGSYGCKCTVSFRFWQYCRRFGSGYVWLAAFVWNQFCSNWLRLIWNSLRRSLGATRPKLSSH